MELEAEEIELYKLYRLYVVVDKDGAEKITNKKPFRAEEIVKHRMTWLPQFGAYLNSSIGTWADDYSGGYWSHPIFSGVVLNKGTIFKITGTNMTWEDDPIEMP